MEKVLQVWIVQIILHVEYLRFPFFVENPRLTHKLIYTVYQEYTVYIFSTGRDCEWGGHLKVNIVTWDKI